MSAKYLWKNTDIVDIIERSGASSNTTITNKFANFPDVSLSTSTYAIYNNAVDRNNRPHPQDLNPPPFYFTDNNDINHNLFRYNFAGGQIAVYKSVLTDTSNNISIPNWATGFKVHMISRNGTTATGTNQTHSRNDDFANIHITPTGQSTGWHWDTLHIELNLFADNSDSFSNDGGYGFKYYSTKIIPIDRGSDGTHTPKLSYTINDNGSSTFEYSVSPSNYNNDDNIDLLMTLNLSPGSDGRTETLETIHKHEYEFNKGEHYNAVHRHRYNMWNNGDHHTDKNDAVIFNIPRTVIGHNNFNRELTIIDLHHNMHLRDKLRENQHFTKLDHAHGGGGGRTHLLGHHDDYHVDDYPTAYNIVRNDDNDNNLTFHGNLKANLYIKEYTNIQGYDEVEKDGNKGGNYNLTAYGRSAHLSLGSYQGYDTYDNEIGNQLEIYFF